MIHLGLTGWPVNHSLSPRLHTAALKAVGLEGSYQLFPIEPLQTDNMRILLDKLRDGELSGLNVTIPYKQSIIRLLDELTPAAREIGAVNTIYLQSGRLIGHNTDAQGFISDLRKKAGKLLDTPGRVIVLGAGGSARAVVSALVGLSWRVTIAARNLTKAQDLVNDLTSHNPDNDICLISLEEISLLHVLDMADLIVNTTPVGMHPLTEFSPWPNGLSWPQQAFVYDLVYNPYKTLFINQAQSHGLQAANGLGMLVEQAAIAFEIWTGKAAPLVVMYSAVMPAQSLSTDL